MRRNSLQIALLVVLSTMATAAPALAYTAGCGPNEPRLVGPPPTST